MKKLMLIGILLIFLVVLSNVGALSGCCSSHEGVCGNKCCDGTSLSAKCSFGSSSTSSSSGDFTITKVYKQEGESCIGDTNCEPELVCADNICRTSYYYCGDGRCLSMFSETCETCSEDCGVCLEEELSVKETQQKVELVEDVNAINQMNIDITEEKSGGGFWYFILFLIIIFGLVKISKKNKKTDSKPKPKEIIFKKCPICKKGKVERIEPSGRLSFMQSDRLICNNCSVKFTEEKEYQEEGTYRLDLSESNQKNKYEGETLKKSEWKRGISDLDLCIKNNNLPKADIRGLNVILHDGEESHWYSNAGLNEERAVRQSYGGAVRVMKGVYIGGSRGESHGELRKIDSGDLLLTNKRLVFNGDLRNNEYKLEKIVTVQEYKDAFEIGLSNRKKVQIFTVDEPHKWATFVRIAVKNNHKKGKKK